MLKRMVKAIHKTSHFLIKYAGNIWLLRRKTLPLPRFRAIAVKEELLDMLRCNDKQFNLKKENGFN